MSNTYHHRGQKTNWNKNPGWWTREMMTAPQRAKVRQLNHEVMKMNRDELEDPPIYPHAKKPHIYYW